MAIQHIIGAANPLPENVVREQAKIEAQGPLNTKKRFFGYGKLAAQKDVAPADQVLTKNSDDDAAMKTWLANASADPLMVWAGYFDNTTGKLVGESTGKGLTISGKKSSLGLILGGIGGIVALVFATRKR